MKQNKRNDKRLPLVFQTLLGWLRKKKLRWKLDAGPPIPLHIHNRVNGHSDLDS